MAYSDYGGYAYRNGQRIEERSDACLTTEGIKSTPGMWPGIVIPEGRSGGSYHALLGDGPIHVGLYKQSYVEVFKHREALPTDFDSDRGEDAVEIDGWKVEIKYEESDNYYVYVRVIQPDGVVWHGFSGYGVGAGLEDAGYGFSTEDREESLFEYFPMD